MGFHQHVILDEDGAERKIPDRLLFKRLLKYLTPHKLGMALLLFMIVAGMVTSLISPYLSLIALDVYLLNATLSFEERLQGLVSIIALFFVVYVANFLISYGRTYLTSLLGRRMEYDLRMDLFSHLQDLSLSYFSKREVGRIMSRITNDVDNLIELISSGVVSALADILTLIGIIAIMLYLNLYLSVTAFIIIPVMILFIWFFGKRSREAYRRTRKTISGVTAKIEESVSGMREIQAYSKEKKSMKTFDRANALDLEANISAARIQSLFFPAVGIFGAIGLAIVLWAGGSLHIANADAMPLGVLFAFMQYLNRFFLPIQNISLFYNNVQAAMSGAERIVGLLDTEVEIKDSVDAVEIPPIKGEIKFENVTFGYDLEKPVLNNIDLQIKPGERVAIVGPTGAGKTTLLNLVYRFYDPQKGHISIDGYDLRDVTKKSLRSQLAIVLQDPFLFSNTIKENIRYGKPHASEEEVVEAAKKVGAHGFILELPEGYDTEVMERGGRLSMGQRQLVSFARVLVMNPQILILDEATSSVDAYTELIIQKALKRILKGRTSLIIAHRLSTIRDADRIIVIDQGRLVEQGNHKQLIRRKGLYRQLYDIQFETNKDTNAYLANGVQDDCDN